jgi:S1-C subfamily serine protease|tara:strand:+ start:7372 stop:8052 length:681 start_codon:yes stop_codon:yes gene_type:complete
MNWLLTFLFTTALLIPASASGNPPETTDIFLSSNTVVNQHQELSRTSSIKIVTPNGHGSGTYIKLGRNYYALTARHVVESINIVAIQAGLEVVVGEVVFRSETQDIALIKIPALGDRTAARIRTFNIQNLEIGEELVYSGYPSQYSILTSGAIVSGKEGRRYILQGFAWPGSSGSGIIDSRGKIRGVLVGVGVETFRNSTQLLETVVWMEPITETTWAEIRSALEL